MNQKVNLIICFCLITRDMKLCMSL